VDETRPDKKSKSNQIKSVALQALTNLGRLSSRRWQSFPTAPDGTELSSMIGVKPSITANSKGIICIVQLYTVELREPFDNFNDLHQVSSVTDFNETLCPSFVL
jgi:hypothetical protein